MKRDQAIFLGGLLVAAVIAVVIVLVTGGGDSDSTTAAELTKPEVEVPDGPPPEELEVTEITEGDGAEAETGDTVTVEYVGVSYSTGEEFDASWGPGDPLTVRLGSGDVIAGWDEGIPGMKVGGRRELVIPPDLAYGRQGQPPAIGPSETLVFVVDLLDVQAAS